MAHTADYWQGRADQTRIIAKFADPVSKPELMKFAREYETLVRNLRAAEHAEQQQCQAVYLGLVRAIMRMALERIGRVK